MAVAQIGQHTFDVCKDYVDEVITVSTDEICAAIKDIYDDTRSITEPAGALSVAAHAALAEGFPEAELVGLCDADPEKAAAQAARFGVPRSFVRLDDMLDTVKPDLVDVVMLQRSLDASGVGGVQRRC